MEFFKYLPKIKYPYLTDDDNLDTVNITARFKIKKWILDNKLAYYSYTIRDEDRPDVISHKYYGSEKYTWLLFITNNIIDPVADWPKETRQFHKYLAGKYKERFRVWWEDPNSNPNAYFAPMEDWNIVDAIQDETFSSGFGPHHYLNLDGFYTYADDLEASAVTIYQYEEELNESRRQIKIIDNIHINQIDTELRKIFNEVK